MLPYFRKAENYEPGANVFHGAGGPLNVADLRDPNPLSRAFVEACARGPQHAGIDELDFVIGHELGHLAAGHLHWFLLPARFVPLLGAAYSRACEYTCDRCGHEVTGDLAISTTALSILAAGGRLGRAIDLDAFGRQREESGGFWMAVHELNASHPYLCKRVA